MLVFSIVMLYLTLEFLKVYTRHGEFVIVPNMVGKTIEECRDNDSIRGNVKLIISDSSYNEKFEAGLILRQIPEANSEVKKKRKVYLTINMAGPQRKAVPVVTDLSFRQAEASLTSAGFFVGEIVYIPSQYKGLVLHQKVGKKEVAANDTLPIGTRIDLYVGSGASSSLIKVPNLMGLTLSEAQEVLKGALLNEGAKIYDESVIGTLDTANAHVWKYKPAENVERGAFIDIYLTVDNSRIHPDTLGVDDTIKETAREDISIVE